MPRSSSRARRSSRSRAGSRRRSRARHECGRGGTGSGDHGEGDARQRARQPGGLPCPSPRQQGGDPTRRRDAVQSEGRKGADVPVPRQDTARGASPRSAAELEEGLRDARRGQPHRLLRGSLSGMPTIQFRPTSPGRRFQTGPDFNEITKDAPEPSLTAPLRKSGGRNNLGRMTIRHRGGGHKRLYRILDFKRDKLSVPATVAAIECDPNRSARIRLLHYADGEKRYILAPVGLAVGDKVEAGPKADIKPGNSLPLANVPLGTTVHNVEFREGRGGQLARSAGAGIQLMAKEGDYALLKLPSGELRRVRLACRATIGQVGNLEHENISYGKAGRIRWLGRRSSVRGIAMNPVDHPHGGGEGRSKGNHPQTPWGKPTKGYKTRHNKRTDRWILQRRKTK